MLYIDAFSVDVFQGKSVCCEHVMSDPHTHLTDCEQITILADAIKRPNERDQQFSSENSMFLFLVSPLNVNHRVFPIHLKSHSSGSAGAAIHSLCCQVIDIISLHPSIQLKFCSVDGDQSYQTYFDEEFDQLLPGTGLILDLSPIVESISKRHHLFIGDFLHVHKNARMRLLDRNIHYNCQSCGSRTNIRERMRMLGPAKYLSDFSSIWRMCDAYPLALCTIENILRVSQDGSVDSFIYCVIYSL
jgi:hypothetical protein